MAAWSPTPHSRRIQRLLLAVLCLGLARSSTAAPGLSEYDVKAAFLFNVAKYADWPPQAFTAGHGPIVIGVLGDDPFGSALDAVVEGRVINGRRIVIRRSRRAVDLRNAHLVFISASERDRIQQICATFANSNVLCVGDTEQVAICGAIMFSVESGKIVFNVNMAAVHNANVRISSKLLHLAKSVRGRANISEVRP